MKSIFHILLAFWLSVLFLIPLAPCLKAQVNAGQDVTVSAGLPVHLKASFAGLTGIPVTAQDDYFVGPFDIGFEFVYFGETHTQFAMGPNGLVSFDLPDILDVVHWTAAPIPNNIFKKTIMGPYQDLFDRPINPHSQYLYYQTSGQAPNRKLIAGWCEAPMFGCGNRFVTYQIVLNESDSSITNHIIEKPSCTANLGNVATQGLNYDNTTGTAVPGRNNSSWTASNESWQFLPNGSESYDVNQIDYAPEPVSPEEKIRYAWYEGSYPGGNQISSAWEVVVSPTETTTYYCEVTLCGDLKFVDDVQVTTLPIPNAFNPNSAAQENRVFRVYADPENRVSKFALYIYNRWGELVFETNDIESGWDGTKNGNPCNAGVYVWTVYYEGSEGESTNKGTVTLVR
jgi:gliding motility-associated-like protein